MVNLRRLFALPETTMATLLLENTVRVLPQARSDEAGLWIPLEDLESATGWALKPQGVCRGEVCVLLPRSREAGFVAGGRFNFTAFARYLGQPIVNHAATSTWAVGETAEARSTALRSLEAPDFTLPDMQGREHTLSDYRGRKVFLVSWASW